MTAVFLEDGPDKGAIWHFGEPNKEQRALAEGTAWSDHVRTTRTSVHGGAGETAVWSRRSLRTHRQQEAVAGSVRGRLAGCGLELSGRGQ